MFHFMIYVLNMDKGKNYAKRTKTTQGENGHFTPKMEDRVS